MNTSLCCALASICIFSAMCAQAKMSVRSMYDGSQVIEPAEVRQLTTLDDGKVESFEFSPDGKSIAYATMTLNGSADSAAIEGRSRIVVVTPSTARRAVLLDAMLSSKDGLPQGEDVVAPSSMQPFSWSPDSRSVAFNVCMYRDTAENQWGAIFIVNRNGSRRGLINLPKGMVFNGPLIWSPNGRKIAAFVQRPASDPRGGYTKSINIYDTMPNVPPIAMDVPEDIISLMRWADDGKGLVCRMRHDGTVSNVEIPVSGEPMRAVEGETSAAKLSPDGAFRLLEGRPGITIEQISSKTEIPLLRKPDCTFINWSPGSKMFAFKKIAEIRDDSESRREPSAALWVGLAQEGRYNHMYVTSLDCGPNGHVSVKWSSDGSTLAYISQDHLYAVRLIARPPATHEKRDLGIQLSEEEMKQALYGNASQIGMGLQMYADNHGGSLPDSATFEQDMSRYTGTSEVFRSPNGGADLYEYFPQRDIRSLANPSETVVITMDAGYEWRVNVYADGHARTVAKDE